MAKEAAAPPLFQKDPMRQPSDQPRVRVYVCSSCRTRCRSWVWQALGIEGAVEAKCPGCQQWVMFASGGWLEEAEEKAA